MRRKDMETTEISVLSVLPCASCSSELQRGVSRLSYWHWSWTCRTLISSVLLVRQWDKKIRMASSDMECTISRLSGLLDLHGSVSPTTWWKAKVEKLLIVHDWMQMISNGLNKCKHERLYLWIQMIAAVVQFKMWCLLAMTYLEW